jgi:SAM-dependent methyltransferase
VSPIVRTGKSTSEITIVLPTSAGSDLDQDEEYCDVVTDGTARRIRFHDYAEIFKIPGLYEKLFADLLECRSPTVLSELLAHTVTAAGDDVTALRVLDFGAGNGMVAEALARVGVKTIFGVDLLAEARAAALRDRPGLYVEYLAADITALDTSARAALNSAEVNCLTCVAALGFDDVPPVAFEAAFNAISTPGWVAFNLRDRYVDRPNAFSELLARMLAAGVVEERAHVRYRHRLSVSGEALEYDAIITRKLDAIPADWLR